jgi:hypothetical protein
MNTMVTAIAAAAARLCLPAGAGLALVALQPDLRSRMTLAGGTGA